MAGLEVVSIFVYVVSCGVTVSFGYSLYLAIQIRKVKNITNHRTTQMEVQIPKRQRRRDRYSDVEIQDSLLVPGFPTAVLRPLPIEPPAEHDLLPGQNTQTGSSSVDVLSVEPTEKSRSEDLSRGSAGTHGSSSGTASTSWSYYDPSATDYSAFVSKRSRMPSLNVSDFVARLDVPKNSEVKEEVTVQEDLRSDGSWEKDFKEASKTGNKDKTVE